MRSSGAANRHSSTQGQRGERKEWSMAAEGQLGGEGDEQEPTGTQKLKIQKNRPKTGFPDFSADYHRNHGYDDIHHLCHIRVWYVAGINHWALGRYTPSELVIYSGNVPYLLKHQSLYFPVCITMLVINF